MLKIRYKDVRKALARITAQLKLLDAEIIVMDYNHVFVESVSRSSLSSMSVDLDSSIPTVDEAHNLPDRYDGLELRLTKKMVNAARFEMEEHEEASERDGASDDELVKIGSSIASTEG